MRVLIIWFTEKRLALSIWDPSFAKLHKQIIEGSLNRNFRQYGELKSSSRVIKSVDRRCNSQKVRRKKIRPRQMLEKSRNAVFFHRFVCRVSPKSRPVKAAGAEVGAERWHQKSHAAAAKSTFGSENVKKTEGPGQLFEVQMFKNCTPLWRKAHSEVKMLKNWRSGTTFVCSAVEKLHAAVAKSTFESPKCAKHRMFGPLFEVQMSKNCTPLWRNAHLEVKMLKNCSPRNTFRRSDVAKLHAAVARSTFGSENVKKLESSEHFSKFGFCKISQVVS